MSFLVIYFISVFIFLNFLYSKIKVYYRPLTYKDKETGKIIDVHKLYEPFHSKDKFNYWKFIISGLFLFPIKFTLDALVIIGCIIHLKIFSIFNKNQDTDPVQYAKLSKIMKFYNYLFLSCSMINLMEKKIDCTEVYKKYLGPDYDFNDNKYSLIICNHIGFFDIITNMYLHACGFIAKEEVSRYWLIGPIAKAINCLFVNRQNESSRKEILEKLYERQIKFLEGKFYTPLVIFPEGANTCGRNILKFKKGAFYHLLPIKPEIINIYQENKIHFTCGGQNVIFNTLKYLCFLTENLYYVKMPIIRPTEFMFQNYSNLGKEKWEIYAEVVRKIYCEIGGFKESNLGYRDAMIYNQAMNKGVFDYEKILGKKKE
jgi:1-acyl-sn-glycerol-3-phosphate acyltransferase